MVCFNIYILFNHKDTSQEHEKHKKLAQPGFIILTVQKIIICIHHHIP